MPWTLGTEVHVDTLHARENVHIDGEVVTRVGGISDVPGLQAALDTKEALLATQNSVLTTPGGSVERVEGTNIIRYTPPDLTSYAPKASPTFSGTLTATDDTVEHVLGDLKLGKVHADAGNAGLKHANYSGGHQFGLLFTSSGQTVLNSCSTQSIMLRHHNSPSTQLEVASSGNVTMNGNLALDSTITYGTIAQQIASTHLALFDSQKFTFQGVTTFEFGRYRATNVQFVQLKGSNLHVDSDDRLKFNEAPIIDGLQVLRALNPVVYDKSNTLHQEVHTFKQVGLIAQEVEQIPQLQHAVHVGGADEAYSLQYDQVWAYALAALKELDAIVSSQAATMAALEARLALLEQR